MSTLWYFYTLGSICYFMASFSHLLTIFVVSTWQPWCYRHWLAFAYVSEHCQCPHWMTWCLMELAEQRYKRMKPVIPLLNILIFLFSCVFLGRPVEIVNVLFLFARSFTLLRYFSCKEPSVRPLLSLKTVE